MRFRLQPSALLTARTTWGLVLVTFVVGWVVRGLLALELALAGSEPLETTSQLVWGDAILPFLAIILPTLCWRWSAHPDSAVRVHRSSRPPPGYRAAPSLRRSVVQRDVDRRSKSYLARLTVLAVVFLVGLPWSETLVFSQPPAASCGWGLSNSWIISWFDFLGVSSLWAAALLWHMPTTRRIVGGSLATQLP